MNKSKKNGFCVKWVNGLNPQGSIKPQEGRVFKTPKRVCLFCSQTPAVKQLRNVLTS